MWKYTGIKECNQFLLSLNLFNCKDEKKYIKVLYTLANGDANNYRIYKLKKHNGKYRTIYEPNQLLKNIQKKILESILETRTVSKYAKAYYKGVSLLDNAYPHINKKLILKLDIKNFFENISFYRVYESCFSIEYFPKSVGMLFTYLCTCNNHLIQGAPTSAYISNLVMKEFDEKLGTWCKLNNITYTRYSDDMTFSGDFNPKKVICIVRKMLSELNLQLNDKKICVIKNYSKQVVTGIVVNQKIQADSKYRKSIRQELYYIKKFGIKSHLKKKKVYMDSKQYMNKLYCKVLFVLQINSKDKEFQGYKNYLHDKIKNFKDIS